MVYDKTCESFIIKNKLFLNLYPGKENHYSQEMGFVLLEYNFYEIYNIPIYAKKIS